MRSRRVVETHKGGFVFLGTDDGTAKQYAQDIAGMRAGTCGRTGGTQAYVPGTPLPRPTQTVPVASGTKDFLHELAVQTLARIEARDFKTRDAESEFVRTTFWATLLTVRLLGERDLVAQLEKYYRLVVKHGRVGITLMLREIA